MSVLLTREVRWFFDGYIPPRVGDWFTADGNWGDHERRVDYYDLEMARVGVGAKYRNVGSLDTKHLLSYRDDVELGGGVRGRIEDWVKVSAFVPTPSTAPRSRFVAVHKSMVTRRRQIVSSADDVHAMAAGYGIELVSIRSGGVRAWSICLETFGAAEHCAEAFRSGIAELLHDVPDPASLKLTGEQSFGYPAWITLSEAATVSELPTNRVAEL